MCVGIIVLRLLLVIVTKSPTFTWDNEEADGPFARDRISRIYYGKMVMVRSKKNAAEAAPLVCEIMYIKSLPESCSSVALDSKDEMNPVYSAL